jgi:hypothetical protein
MKFIKSLLKYILNYFKIFFNLNKLNSFENSGKISTFTKLKLFYKSEVILPFRLGRTIRGLSFDGNAKKDPFYIFTKGILEEKNQNQLLKYFANFLKKEKMSSASDLVGIKKNINLSKYPAWALVMPWDKENIDDRYLNYPKAFLDNRLKNKLVISKSSINLKKFSNNIFYTLEAARSQYYQTKNLLESIKKNGIMKTNFLPRVEILIDGKKWRWFVSGDGNHRAYILSILGNKNFHCVVEQIIYKKDLLNWFNVKNSTYSPKEADYIFKHFFKGDKCLRGLV